MAADNKSLGRFILDGIPPAPRGVPQIEVSFDIDANGILNVKASDKATGREQHITIQPSSGLSDKEIDQMVQDAKQHAAEDEARKEQQEVRNLADSTIYSAEKSLRDFGDKLDDETKNRVQSLIDETRTAIENSDVETMRTKTNQLMQETMSIGEQMYAQQSNGSDPSGSGEAGTEPGGEDVVEGEVVE
jgi:molecular chaperone DnaK